jgi:hypothetical protein
MQSQWLRAWKLGLTTSHGFQVPSLKYDMDAYMKTFFGGLFWDLCRDGSSKKLDLALNTNPVNIFA